VDSVPTSDNQEDHVSMGMTAALMALDAVERCETVVAIEVLCGCQALDLSPGRAAPGTHAIYEAVRARVPVLVEDRPPSADIAAACAVLRAGGVTRALADALGAGAGRPRG
jgi:histidine ammonia-lyase